MPAFWLRGLGDGIFQGSKLLNCCENFCILAESRWVFERIISNNLCLLNSILVGYFQLINLVKFLGQLTLEFEKMEVVLSWEVWNLAEGFLWMLSSLG